MATPASLLPVTPDPAYAKGVVLVLLAGCCWSIAGLVVRLIEAAGEWQILLYRSLTLVMVLVVWIGVRSRGSIVSAFRAAGLKAALAERGA